MKVIELLLKVKNCLYNMIGGINFMKIKKILKKINFDKENIYVKTLQCYCACQGRVNKAVANGYAGSSLR